MPRDGVNFRVVIVAASLLLLFAFLLATAAWIWGRVGELTEFLSIIVAAFIMEGGIALVGYLILLHREHSWRATTQARWHADFAAFFADQEQRMASITVQCPACKKRAVPIANSDNRFHCNDCEKDFADRHHGVIDAIEYERRSPNTSDGPYPLSP